MSFIADLTLREKLLYGTGILLSLIIFFGGIVLMVFAFTGSDTPSEEGSNNASEERNSNSGTEEENEENSGGGQGQLSSTDVFTPSQILPNGIQAFRIVGDEIIYLTEDSTLRKTSFASGENKQLETLSFDTPEYVYIPPQSDPSFVIVKTDGRYKTVTFGRDTETFRLPQEVAYITVEPVSETIYAIMAPQDAMTNITKMSLEGNNTQKILSRMRLNKLEFAGNNLFYSTQSEMYEYNLSENKELTILNENETSGVPRFSMSRDYFVGVVTSGSTSYLYSFADTPRELQTLDLTVPPRRVIWSNQKRAFLHVKEQTIRTFTWQNDNVTRDRVNLNGISIAYPNISTDPNGSIIFLSTSDQAVYRLVTGRI